MLVRNVMYELSKLQFVLIVVQHILKSDKLLKKKHLQIGRVMGKEVCNHLLLPLTYGLTGF